MRLFTKIKTIFSILLVVIAFAGCDEKVSPNLPDPELDKLYAGQGGSNGHKWVDLGLPSGLKWATCNVGASSPEENGDYFAWGETKRKSDPFSSLTDYMTESDLRSRDIIDSFGNLKSSYDAANANFGVSWRMPTKAECQELLDKCRWTWTTLNGKNGYKVTGLNGNSIFLPAADYLNDGTQSHDGESGYYWSSTVYSGYDTNSSFDLQFGSRYISINVNERRRGEAVRPVTE